VVVGALPGEVRRRSGADGLEGLLHQESAVGARCELAEGVQQGVGHLDREDSENLGTQDRRGWALGTQPLSQGSDGDLVDAVAAGPHATRR
jgi:hypothetical protein